MPFEARKTEDAAYAAADSSADHCFLVTLVAQNTAVVRLSTQWDEALTTEAMHSAAEDIGLANPNALLLANAAFDAVMKIGWPEGRIPLAEAAVYLATSPKSNSAYLGIDKALALVRETGNLPVPLHLRNAPTKLMSQLGYADGYRYSHDYPGHFVEQQFLPDELKNHRLWMAQHYPNEEKLYQQMLRCWGDRFRDDQS